MVDTVDKNLIRTLTLNQTSLAIYKLIRFIYYFYVLKSDSLYYSMERTRLMTYGQEEKKYSRI